MAPSFLLTTGRWYNKLDEDGDYRKAPAYREGFTYDSFAYGSDTPEDFTPAGGVPVQYSLICAKQTFLLVADIDYPENLPGSETGQHVSWNDAMSVRGSHFHVGIDMRGVPADDWPTQGRTAWGDIKANGFVAAPGSVHYSGEPYAPASASPVSKLVKATPALIAALAADRAAHALARLNEGLAARGLPAGTRLENGAYLYASGFVRGTWGQLPDGHLKHDDELKDLLWDMHVIYGRPEEECREQWFRLAGALGRPWTEKHFLRHWSKCPAARLKALEDDDTTRLREDFGLELLDPAWKEAHKRQRARYEEHLAEEVQAAARPPQPPPDWGFEVPGISYFPLWLGTGPFDAGRPTDADNALAVLNRSHPVLRYDEETATWLLRGTGKWDGFPGADASRSVIAGLRAFLPEGCADPSKHPAWEHLDPDTDAGTIAALKNQAKNRERFSSSNTVGAVARSMTDYVLHHRDTGTTVRSRDLDTEPEILWAGGVPWNLKESDKGPVASNTDRNTPHRMTAAVVPDLSVETRRWNAFCEAVWPDVAGREWALDVLAVGFTGYADAVMPVLLGDGGLGKTFLMNLLNSVLGDYGGVMHGDLLKPDARLHGAFTIKLKGMRLAFVDEAPGKGQASQEHLKKITGGGKMEGNKMRENPVEFTPTHTLVLAANFERMPPMHEDALQRRVRLIKFEGSPADVKAAANALGNSAHSVEWREEMPGVLAQMMRRAALWLKDRTRSDADRAPMTWQTWRDEVISEQDPVLGWLTGGEIVPDPAGTQASVLHEHYIGWRRRHGETGEPLNSTRFGTALTKLGYLPDKRRDANYRPLRVVQPGLAEFMGGAGRGYSTTHHSPPHPPQTRHGENPSSSGGFPVVVEGVEGVDSHTAHTKKLDTPPTAQAREEMGAVPPPVHATGACGQSDLQEHPVVEGSGVSTDPPPSAGPVVPDEAVQPETAKKASGAQNGQTPPDRKTPRTRLTPEQKLERAEAARQLRAQARAGARKAKVAELGGPLVQLPAVVLRDQSVLPVDVAAAARWLEPMLGELSVDVEHSGYPRQHRDYALRLVQVGDEFSAVVLDPADPAQAAVIRDVLARARVLHAHSALADLIPLEAAGLCDASAWGRLVDTVNIAKLTDPALTDSDEAALKPLAKALLGPGYALSWKCDELRKETFAAGGWIGECEVTTPAERSGWANIPVCEGFVRYAASDVMDCSAVARVLQERT